jgi:hypothetical protein
VKKFIAFLILLAAGNSCVAMNENRLSNENGSCDLITYTRLIKTPSKENIKINLQVAGFGYFCEQSKIDENLGDRYLEPVTIIGYVNGYLKELGYANDSNAQPRIIKIIIDNDAVYKRLMRTGWVNSDRSNIYS